MLRTLFRAVSSQSSQKAAPAPLAAKCIDPSLHKLVAGGAPKGGWLDPEVELATQAPKGGWA
jgi:hypothetical protein